MVFLASKVRQLAIQGLDIADYQRVEIEDFPSTNLAILSQHSSELEANGFVVVGEFSTQRNTSLGCTAFGRLLFNYQARCTATVSQVFLEQKGFHQASVVLSTELADGWYVGTHNIPANPASAIMRHPRIIGCHFPLMSIGEMLTVHLKYRDKIVERLGLQIVRPTTFEAHIRSLAEDTKDRRELVKMKSSIQCAIEYWRETFFPKAEWLGDVPKESKRFKLSPLA
jgi:hypothetical protein